MSGMNINNRTGWIRPLPGADPQLSEIPAGLKSSATSADGKRGDPGGSITILNHWQLIQRRVGTEAGGGAYANEERQSRPQSAHLHTTNKAPDQIRSMANLQPIFFIVAFRFSFDGFEPLR